MKEDKIIQDWLKLELSPEEKLRMERVISFTEKLEVPVGKKKDQAWNDLMDKIQEESVDNSRILRVQKRSTKSWLWIASAAAIVLITVFGFLNRKPTQITVRALAGELRSVILPDNSIVTLNAESILTYKEERFIKERTVSLSGEAFFEVTPGTKFKVISNDSEVMVIGTSFNVNNRENNLKVSVFSGRVRVSHGLSNVLLERGKEAYLEKESLLTREFNLNQTASWLNGNFYFDTKPLKEVIDELERQFNIKIQVKSDISERFYSGYFSKNNLTEALQLVFVPMGLSIQSNGNQVTIE